MNEDITTITIKILMTCMEKDIILTIRNKHNKISSVDQGIGSHCYFLGCAKNAQRLHKT